MNIVLIIAMVNSCSDIYVLRTHTLLDITLNAFKPKYMVMQHTERRERGTLTLR